MSGRIHAGQRPFSRGTTRLEHADGHIRTRGHHRRPLSRPRAVRQNDRLLGDFQVCVAERPSRRSAPADIPQRPNETARHHEPSDREAAKHGPHPVLPHDTQPVGSHDRRPAPPQPSQADIQQRPNRSGGRHGHAYRPHASQMRLPIGARIIACAAHRPPRAGKSVCLPGLGHGVAEQSPPQLIVRQLTGVRRRERGGGPSFPIREHAPSTRAATVRTTAMNPRVLARGRTPSPEDAAPSLERRDPRGRRARSWRRSGDARARRRTPCGRAAALPGPSRRPPRSPHRRPYRCPYRRPPRRPRRPCQCPHRRTHRRTRRHPRRRSIAGSLVRGAATPL